MTVTNRLTRFLDVPASDRSLPVARSPAQQAAARKNGAKSRGPTTEQGKAKSRLNALKHGLFAIVAPTHDPREFHRSFRRIRKQLIEEFVGDKQPGFMLTTLIDSLAHDLLQAARGRRMIEQAHLGRTSFAVNAQDRMDQARYAFLERARKPLADAIVALGKGNCVSLPSDLVEPIAVEVFYVVDIAEDLMDMTADISPDLAPPLPSLQAEAKQPYVPNAEELAEIRHAENLKRRCGKDWPTLGTIDALTPFLGGERTYGKTFAKRLGLLLVEVLKGLSQYEDVGRRMRKLAKARADAALYGVATDLPKLQLLHTHLTTIDRRIDAQLLRLKIWQVSGSFQKVGE